MNDAADFIQAVASVLWPLVVACLLVFLLPTLRSTIRRSDSINVEIAGTKVSVQRASDELRKLISDLQDRINELERTGNEGEPTYPAYAPPRDVRRSVLWVDDRVEANVFERARLRDAHYRVVLAESTTTALNLRQSDGPFDVIISDMRRIESGGQLNPRAGLDLLKAIRRSGDLTPVIFYSSTQSLAPVRLELDTENAVSYTTSPSELMALIGVAES